MPEPIVFVVPSVAKPEPRKRHRQMNMGGKQFTQTYTPTTAPVNAFKAAVQSAFASAYQGAPIQGPVSLTLTYMLPRPKKLCWKKRPMPRLWHDIKPDKDNLEKSLMDALKGLAWRDDAQVCRSLTEKVVASGNEQPRVEVRIEELGDYVTHSDPQ